MILQYFIHRFRFCCKCVLINFILTFIIVSRSVVCEVLETFLLAKLSAVNAHVDGELFDVTSLMRQNNLYIVCAMWTMDIALKLNYIAL